MEQSGGSVAGWIVKLARREAVIGRASNDAAGAHDLSKSIVPAFVGLVHDENRNKIYSSQTREVKQLTLPRHVRVVFRGNDYKVAAHVWI